MSDEAGLRPDESGGDTRMFRASTDAGLEAGADQSGDYRDQLRSRRWDAAPLTNPEVEKTDPRIAAAAIVILGAITLLILVVGYGSGFWELA